MGKKHEKFSQIILLCDLRKCEMEKSKATITLRFTAFMESNILRYANKTVFQKCKT